MPEVMVGYSYRGTEEPFSDSFFVSQLLELGRNGEQPRAAPEDSEEVSLVAAVFSCLQAWFHGLVVSTLPSTSTPSIFHQTGLYPSPAGSL